MAQDLSNINIAILIANGFTQSDVVAAQRYFQNAKAKVKLISSENGLVNGWEGKGWGHHFASDISLNSALAADFDMLIIPGGEAHVEKLLKTEHTKRFVSGFMRGYKTIVTVSEAIKVLIESGTLRDYMVAAPEQFKSDIMGENAEFMSDALYVDEHLITTAGPVEDYDALYDAASQSVLDSEMDMDEAA